MLVLMKIMLEFCLKMMTFRSVKQYHYQVISDQIFMRLNKLYKTTEYTSLNYPIKISGGICVECCNRTSGETLISFAIPREDGIAVIKNFDLSCLDFFKDHICYITRYSIVNNFHSVAYFNNGKITKFYFILAISSASIPRKDNNYVELSITTDDQFQPLEIVKKLCIYSPTSLVSKQLIKNNVSFDDEIELIKLKAQSENPEINVLIPEINTPSAYDFNSDDFNNRLLLVAMMES